MSDYRNWTLDCSDKGLADEAQYLMFQMGVVERLQHSTPSERVALFIEIGQSLEHHLKRGGSIDDLFEERDGKFFLKKEPE